MKRTGRSWRHQKRSRSGSIASLGAVIAIAVLLILATVIYVESRGTARSPVSPHASITFASLVGTSLTTSAVTNSTSTTNPSFLVVAGNNHTSIVKITILNGSSTDSSSAGYSPDSITVAIGVNNTVVWTNNDKVAHSIVASDGLFNSGAIQPTQSFTFTFVTAGTYTYTDPTYTSMRGTIVVLG